MMEALAISTQSSSKSSDPRVEPQSNIWKQVLCVLEPKVAPRDFAMWLRPTEYGGVQGSSLHVVVPNQTFKDWLDAHYRPQAEDAMRSLGLPVAALEFIVAAAPGGSAAAPGGSGAAVEPAGNGRALPAGAEEAFPPLNQKYVFDSFVVGSSNQFAHAAAVRVAGHPGGSFNPLFLYGGSGLGKTHLMQAIGHELRERCPNLRLVYISAERFLNEMVRSLKENEMTAFHHRFRNIDALLVDDVQFLSGKERITEEFFHTFNTLHERQMQIVLSSDRPPKEIDHIDERLRSRFEWGLLADIQPPDLETRQAILMKKAEAEDFPLPERVALFIASNVKSSVRELEGSLTKLMAFASIMTHGEPVTEAMARQVLKDLVETEAKRVSIELIQKTVCEHYGVRLTEMKAKNNSKRVVRPRQTAMWLSRQLTKSSLPEIARAFGDKHHTTVLHSINKIEDERQVDKELARALSKLLTILEG